METRNVILDYKDDLFFKYYCGKDGAETMDFRRFMIEHITGLKIGDSPTNNTEPTTLTVGDKKIIMDTFIMQNNFCLDMEMQNSSLDAYQSKRFQYYACKNIVLQMVANEKNYQNIKEFHLILFINQYDKDKLIKHITMRCEDGDIINDCVIYIHLVNLKSINRIARERKLNEFEAVIYLIANNTLKGIEYEEKEGMVTYMERSNRDFSADLPMMKKLLEEREKEFFHAMELEERQRTGIVIGEERGVRKILQRRIMKKYNEDASDWLSHCQESELYEINDLIDDGVSYDDLIRRFVF